MMNKIINFTEENNSNVFDQNCNIFIKMFIPRPLWTVKDIHDTGEASRLQKRKIK